MTDEFAETYLATKDDVREEFVADRTEVQVRVLGQSVSRASASSVQALLFFNQYVTKRGEQTSFSEYRALVTVVDTPDGWLVSDIETQ
jgi:Mce-associated membrane protein